VIRHCRACEVQELSRHPEFEQALVGRGSPPPELLYLWQDHTVTELPLADAETLFASDGAAWHEFCDRLLGSAAPA
jgi:hypothetical protein